MKRLKLPILPPIFKRKTTTNQLTDEMTFSKDNVISQYIGQWLFEDTLTNKAHSLKIDTDLAIIIDQHVLPGQICEITTEHLLFIDHFGYQLQINCQENLPVNVYDEAEDMTYPLINRS